MRTISYYILPALMSCAFASAKAQVSTSINSYNVKGALKSALPIANTQDLKAYKDIFKPRLRITGFSVEASSIYNRSLTSNDYYTTNNLFQYSARNIFSIEVSGIPIKAEYIRRESTPAFMELAQKDWYKVSFDVEKYKEKWKKLAEKLGPGSLSKFGAQAKELQKTFTNKLIETTKDKAKSKLQGTLDSISGNINPLEFEGKSAQEIASMFFGQDLDKLLEEAKNKLQKVEESTLQGVERDSTVNSLKEKIETLESKAKYIKKLVALVKVAKSSGMLNMIKDLDGKAKDEYTKLLNNPGELANRMAEKYNLGGLEKLLPLLSQLKGGGQSVPFADNANVPFLSKGISFEINIKDKFLGFSTGKLVPVFNNLQLNETPNSPSQVPVPVDKSSYWFLNYRKGLEQSNHKGIKLTSISNTGGSSNSMQSTNFQKKNTLLVNLYSRERLFGNNWLNAEVSKSIATSPYDYTINSVTGERKNTKPNYFTLDNLAVKLKAEGNFEKAGINHQLYFNKLLGSYSNITDNYLSSTGYEAGFSVRMKQKGKKLSSYVKGTIRNFKTPGAADSKWNTTDLRTRFSYKLKKGQSIQFATVWHDGYKTYFLNEVQQVIRQQSKGVTVDANLVNKRIFGLYNTSYISAGFQKDIFPISGLSNDKIVSNSYNVLLNQSFLYGDHLLLLNVFYTKVSQNMDSLLYNTRLDIDAGGTFKLSKNITAGFSAVYGYFKGAYTNVGIKSSISATLLKKLQIEIYSDVRKNIKLINPLFDQFINVNCDLKYTIK